MTKEEKAQLNAVEQVSAILLRYNEKFKTIEEFAPFLDIFNETSKKLHDALGVQEKVSSGAKVVALSDREIMADTVLIYTLRAKVLVKNDKYAELYDVLNKPRTYYLSGAKTVSVEHAKDALNALKDNRDILTNIKDEDIKEIEDVIKSYNETKNDAVENIKVRKATATDVIPVLFEDNSDAVDAMYDLTFSYFIKTDATIVDEFALAKQVVNTGVRHTGITFEIVDSETDKPIEGVTITDVSNKKVYVTDENGDAHIDRHLAGTFHFMIEAKGKPSKDYVAIIKRSIDNIFVIKI